MIYTIYSKTDCSFCENAKKALTNKGEEYKVLILGIDFSREQLIELFPGVKSLPIILKDDQYIGGYSELLDHLFPKLES